MEHALFPAYRRAKAAEEAARRNHYDGEEVTQSFWKNATASLPPQARRRYAPLFEAAERYEPLLDLIVDSCREAPRWIGKLASHL